MLIIAIMTTITTTTMSSSRPVHTGPRAERPRRRRRRPRRCRPRRTPRHTRPRVVLCRRTTRQNTLSDIFLTGFSFSFAHLSFVPSFCLVICRVSVDRPPLSSCCTAAACWAHRRCTRPSRRTPRSSLRRSQSHRHVSQHFRLIRYEFLVLN